jgi:hypothetical protein
MNAINVISPFKHHGMWVFDDPRVALVQEPFVAGTDTMIDRVVADIPDPERGFTLIFSSTPFPGYQHRLDWQREEGDGNWYQCSALATSKRRQSSYLSKRSPGSAASRVEPRGGRASVGWHGCASGRTG